MPLLAFVQKHLASKGTDISKLKHGPAAKKARTTTTVKAPKPGAKHELPSFLKKK